MTKLLLMLAVAGFAAADCLPVTANRILAGDLAAADPQFAALPASLTVGFAPAPGSRRVFSGAELERIARANAIAVRTPSEICFALPMRQVREEEVTAAMRKSLPADAELRIIDLQKTDAPVGQIEFPIEGLEPASPAAPGTRLWRGCIRYAETRKATLWARVSVAIRFDAFIAVKDLPANVLIDVSALRMETQAGSIQREKVATHMEEVSGRMPKVALKAGSLIPLAALVQPPAVRRGDSVRVDVESGPAHLHFEAVAESAANEGETIDLRNPLNGKIFRAKLQPGGRAVVIVPPGAGL